PAFSPRRRRDRCKPGAACHIRGAVAPPPAQGPYDTSGTGISAAQASADEVGGEQNHQRDPTRREPAMQNLIEKLMKDESGQDLAEYGIALAVIAGAVSVAVLAGKNKVGSLWSTAQTEIEKF